MIDVWQYSEYALSSKYTTVLNNLALQKVINKIFHHRCLAGFWICLEFWIYQCCTWFCRKRSVIHVWQVSEYSLGSEYARTWIYTGCGYANVLRKLYFKDSQYFECLEFWICKSFEFIRSLNMLYVRVINIKVLNMQKFWMYQEPKYAILKGTKY